MKLPVFHTDDKDFQLMQTSWQSVLNPVISNPLVNGNSLSSISLISGTTIINHKLGRKLQGYFITDINGAATIYRAAPKNDLTLSLTSSAAVIVDIYVF